MTGLNAGFELDHELGDGEDKIVELMFDKTNPGDIPEFSGDVQIMAAVSDKLTDLGYLRQDIHRAGGMSKGFALEAERLMPGFINDDRPIGYFTALPTQTQYKEALLALEQEEKSLISRIWESIKTFVSKVIDFVGEFVNIFFGKNIDEVNKVYEEKPVEFAEDLEQVSKAIRDPKSVLAAVTRLTSDKNSSEFKEYVAALENTLVSSEEKLKDLYDSINQNDYTYAIVNGSRVIHDLINTSSKLPAFVQIMQELIENGLDEVVDEDLTEEEHRKVVEKYKSVVASKIGISEMDNFEGMEKQYRQALSSRVSEYSVDNLSLADIYKRFGSVFEGKNIDHFRTTLGETLERFRKLLKAAEAMKVIPKVGDSKSIILMNQYIGWVYREMKSLFAIIVMTQGILNQWKRISLMLKQSSSSFKAKIQLRLSSLDEESQKRIKQYFGIAYELAETA